MIRSSPRAILSMPLRTVTSRLSIDSDPPRARVARLALATALGFATLACAGDSPVPVADGEWVGTISDEGGVTTVVNRSGSVWGGTSTLVEEASIGVEEGAEPYMLGRVSGLAADERRIYVLDAQVPALRIYDLEGVHQLDIAPIGQGPGEFQRPDGFALAPDGALYVTDINTGRRLVSFERDGTPRATVRVDGMWQAAPYRVDEQGVTTVLVGAELAEVAADGSILRRRTLPTFDRSPWTVQTPAREGMSASMHAVPFAPASAFVVMADGGLARAVSDRYRITVESSDDSAGELVIEREDARVPIEPDEKEWHERVFRARVAVWGTPEGRVPETPSFKPALSRLVGNSDGSLWVVRPGPGVRTEPCAAASTDIQELMQNPCWTNSSILDVFGPDGRFLGDIDLPEGFRFNPRPAVSGDRVVAAVEDEAGTIRVKRFRLVLPD